jgi:hypothetical protein
MSRVVGTLVAGLAAALALQACSASGPGAGHGGPAVGPVSPVSSPCRHGNSEVVTASDRASGLVYSAWIGCRSIAFSLSSDGARTWHRPVLLPGSVGHPAWDPAITLGPSGRVYVAFMVLSGGRIYPVVDISADHGGTFAVHSVGAPRAGNFGDRDWIAVGPTGRIYLTWDYAPSRRLVQVVCFKGASCAYKAGDLNEVLQMSSDGGKTWSGIVPLAPGYPDSGSLSAPILVAPGGRIDALYIRYSIAPGVLSLGTAHEYFTSSADNGRTWTRPVRLGPAGLTISRTTWWIDGSLAADSAGNLYAAWDTQSGGSDIGWLSYSTTGGRTWSPPLRVTSGSGESANILQVLGGTAGTAYVGLLTNSSGAGYADYVRAFSVGRGWRTGLIKISAANGSPSVWPGDTIGLAPLPQGGPGHRVIVATWGGAVGSKLSAIWSAVVSRLP